MKIDINGIQWSIIEALPTDTRLLINDKLCFGICEYAPKNIIIDKTLKKDVKKQTLRHELTHAFINGFFIDKKETYSEEELAEFVALYSAKICEITDKYISNNDESDTDD